MFGHIVSRGGRSEYLRLRRSRVSRYDCSKKFFAHNFHQRHCIPRYNIKRGTRYESERKSKETNNQKLSRRSIWRQEDFDRRTGLPCHKSRQEYRFGRASRERAIRTKITSLHDHAR